MSSTAYTTQEFPGPWRLERAISTRERMTSTIPVVATSTGANRTALRIVIPVDAGDMLKLGGRIRVTNDITGVKYMVGVGAWFDGYDCDNGDDPDYPVWIRAAVGYDDELGGTTGSNVDPSGGPAGIHHMALPLGPDRWRVPADWPEGHRLCVAIRFGAASSGWNRNDGKDIIKLDDGYNSLDVERWVPIS